jgi:glycosyltransferase involved in cell wall biosynthesis
MRIGIDARGAMKVTDGIGRYAAELLKEYSRRDDTHEFFVLKNPQTRMSFAYDQRFHEIVVQHNRFGAREQLLLPRILAALHLDVFHALHFALPVAYRGAAVMSVHDILPLLSPWSFGRSGLRNSAASAYLSALIRMSIRKASAVIVSSDHTRRDMTKHLGTPHGKMRRVYLGIDHVQYREPAVDEALLARLGLAPPFIVTVTNFKPHKNTGTLIEAFRVARRTVPDLQLAIVGDNPRGFAETFGTAQELAAGGIHILGYLDDEAVSGVMAAATAFVYPSLYEGFGFPVLEAMAAGLPVVTSSAASLPELGGDAVRYVQPRDPGDIARAILALCNDTALQSDLRVRGRAQAALFPWKATADATMSIYNDVVTRAVHKPT